MDREKMIAAAREFVFRRADGTPDEMALYSRIAADFATEVRDEAVKAERKRIAQDLTEAHNDDCSGKHCVVCHFVMELEAE